MKKLSELSKDVELSYEDAGFAYTAAELKQELLNSLVDNEYLLSKDWFLIERKHWKPDARNMIDVYIENEYQEMYEDWDERAMDCISDEIISKLQNVLEEALKGDSVTEYWNYTESVEIDVKNL